MKIKAEIKKVFTNGGKVKAVAALTFDNVFVVKNVRIVDGAKGLFVAMPNRKNEVGEFKDICFPIDKDFRTEIHNEVMTAYEVALAEQSKASDDANSSHEQETA